MTREVTSAGGFRIVLPGTWGNVPLASPDESERFVRRLVRRQVGSSDRLARARREASQQILRNARDAAAAGVHTYLVSLELLPGVPFPAAVLVLDEEWPAAALPALEDGDVAEALRRAFPAGEVATQRNGPVARVTEMVRGATEEGVEMLTMRLEYHIPVPDRSRLLLARVNVPNIPSAEPFATLFDEILDSVTFLDASEGGTAGDVPASPAPAREASR
jgi:hypothetical protein